MARDITITFEDGTTHTYQGAPDSVTPDQIEQRAASDFAGRRVTNIARTNAAPTPARVPTPDIPGTPAGYADRVSLIPTGGYPAAPPAVNPAPAPQEDRGLFSRIRAGVEAARNTIASIVPGGVGFGLGAAEGMLRNIASGKYGTQEGANLVEQTAANRAQQFTEATVAKPPSALGQEYARDVGEFAQRHGASVLAGPLGVTGTGRHTENLRNARQGLKAGLPITDALPQRARGVLPEVTAADLVPDRGVPAGLPPVAPGAEKPAGGLTKRVVQPNPALLEDVKTAENIGLTVLPHHVSESDTMRAVGAAMGGDTYVNNVKAYTRALIERLDPESTAEQLTIKNYHAAFDKQGRGIGAGMARHKLPLEDMRARLEAISKDVASNADAETGRLTTNRIDEIINKAEGNGDVLPGQAARELDTAIGRQIRSNAKNQDLVDRLRDIQNIMRDTVEKQMSPAEAKEMRGFRQRYAYAMEILPDIDDFGRTGYYEPGQLWKRITSTEAGRQRVARENSGLLDFAKAGALVADRSGTGHGFVSVGKNGVGLGGGGVRAYADPSRLAEIAAGAVLGTKAYKRFGPNLVKRLAAEHDAELARAAQVPEPPPLELAPEGTPAPQAPRPDVRGEAPAEVPEWAAEAPSRIARPGDQIPTIEPEGLFTTPDDNPPPPRIVRSTGDARRAVPPQHVVDPEDPGALPREEAPRKLRGPAEPAIVTAGQVAAQRDVQPPLLERRPAEIGEGFRRSRVPDIPAVPGRPDMPDVMVAGGPGEVAGNLASGATGAGKKGPIRGTTGTNEAMQSEGAALAREQQGFAPPKAPPETPPPASGPGNGGSTPPGGGMDPRLAKIAELRRRSTSPAVTKVLDAQEAALKKVIKREKDIADLEAAAQSTDDPGLRQTLVDEANKLRSEKIPVGEVKEGQPALPKDKAEKIPVGRVIEGQPELPTEKPERLPTGEATEITPEVVEAAPERLPVGEATEMPKPLPVGEVTENPIPVGEAAEFEPLPVGKATEITPETVEPARGPVVPEATNVDNAPTAPAGGGRSEGMEQTNGAAGYAAEKPAWEGVKARASAAAEALRKYPKLPNGLTPDDVRSTAAWRKDYAEYEQAFANERVWNARMLRRYGAEIRAERAAEREAKLSAARQENTRTDPQPAPTGPAGGGRSEGMEQTKGLAELNEADRRAAIDRETAEHRPDAPEVAQPMAGRQVTVVAKTLNGYSNVRAKLYEVPGYKGPQLAVKEYKTSRGQGYRVYLPKSGAFIYDNNGVGSLADALDMAVLRVANAKRSLAERGTPPPKETPRAPQEVTQQVSVPAEPQGRTGGRGTAEAGAGDRVQRATEGGGQVEGAKKEGMKPARPAAKPAGKGLTPAEVKAEFQRQIDAVPRFGDGGPETITLKAGSSTAKIQNTARRVAEYMKSLDTVKDKKFVAARKAQPIERAKAAYKKARWDEQVPAVSFGDALDKRAPITTIKDMIDDLDPQAAVDFAAVQGIDPEEALKGDRKRLDQVRNLKPTPETP